MEVKKNPKFDLENYRNTFLLTGLLIAISACLVAFQWAVPFATSELGKVTELHDDLASMVVTVRQTKSAPIEKNIQKIKKIVIGDPVTDPNPQKKLELGDLPDPIDEGSEGPVTIDLPDEEGEIIGFEVLERVPTYPGCEGVASNAERKKCLEQNILKYISSEFVYSQKARDMGIQGKLYIKFIFEKDGSISNIEVIRGVDPLLDSEAIRVLRGLPKVEPAKQRGVPVRTAYMVPINAKLR